MIYGFKVIDVTEEKPDDSQFFPVNVNGNVDFREFDTEEEVISDVGYHAGKYSEEGGKK